MALQISNESLERYLQGELGEDVRLEGVGDIGLPSEQGIKEFGYGKSYNVVVEQGGQRREIVLSTMRGDRYGHQYMWDRAAILMFEYYTSGKLEKHIRPVGLGYVNEAGELVPLKDPQEFFIVNEKAEGRVYFQDLERIGKSGLEDEDLERVRQFARWLAAIHADKHRDDDMYLRRIRQLIGDSECIWGLIDAYPYPYEYFPPENFQALERQLVGWRWKLRNYTHRLCATHGDFHPWNVIITPDEDFCVLDRSRGEWGEPADDVAAMSSNYFFSGLCQDSDTATAYERLYLTFWEEYLDQTDDTQMLEVIAPFYVFRGLVLAHPEWYPSLSPEVRRAILRFLGNILLEERFDYANVNKYLE
ncbi:MAG: phosphotransferase [Dehalococcoidia bacterium]